MKGEGGGKVKGTAAEQTATWVNGLELTAVVLPRLTKLHRRLAYVRTCETSVRLRVSEGKRGRWGDVVASAAKM